MVTKLPSRVARRHDHRGDVLSAETGTYDSPSTPHGRGRQRIMCTGGRACQGVGTLTSRGAPNDSSATHRPGTDDQARDERGNGHERDTAVERAWSVAEAALRAYTRAGRRGPAGGRCRRRPTRRSAPGTAAGLRDVRAHGFEPGRRAGLGRILDLIHRRHFNTAAGFNAASAVATAPRR